MLKQQWISGNKVDLLENGEEFFPRVFEAIATAREQVLLETFILFDDKVGQGLHQALLEAAQRGVQIDITIDGWGSPDLPDSFIAALTAAGIRVHVFDAVPGILRRAKMFRRLHRKIVVIDGKRAFIGGINYSADHLADFGPEAKQDYSVEVQGPIVRQIHAFALNMLAGKRERRRWFRPRPPLADTSAVAGDAEIAFVWRDNHRHTRDIERQYRLAIRLARQRVVIANAYFFPGYSFLKELRNAAKRGVEVALILQGNPDMPIVQTAASMLYHHLLNDGVQIYEYCDRPLHGKVAVIDDAWATVGSSNLDPLSLSLNLEANVLIRDRSFTATLGQRLQRLMDESCKKIDIRDLQESNWWRVIRSFFLFHLLRRYPAWIGWLPAHAPRIKVLQAAPESHDVHAPEREACQ
jgi:cardiolipin synthase